MATNIGNIGRWQMAGNNIKMDNTTVIPPTLGQSAGELIIKQTRRKGPWGPETTS